MGRCDGSIWSSGKLLLKSRSQMLCVPLYMLALQSLCTEACCVVRHRNEAYIQTQLHHHVSLVHMPSQAWDINTKRLNMQSKSGGSKRDLAPLLPPDQVHLLGTLGSEDVSELAGTPRSNNAELC